MKLIYQGIIYIFDPVSKVSLKVMILYVLFRVFVDAEVHKNRLLPNQKICRCAAMKLIFEAIIYIFDPAKIFERYLMCTPKQF